MPFLTLTLLLEKVTPPSRHSPLIPHNDKRTYGEHKLIFREAKNECDAPLRPFDRSKSILPANIDSGAKIVPDGVQSPSFTALP
jgi:hypothetical protein